MNQRQIDIYRLIQSSSSVETTALAKKFNVSTMTIRRDLNYFASKGIVTLVYGGAVKDAPPEFFDSPGDEDEAITAEKRRIAKAAAALIKDGDTVILDAGTTVREIAVELMSKHGITIITNGIHTLNVLSQVSEDKTLIIAPGQYHARPMSIYGSMTNDFLQQVHVDHAFISTEGFCTEMGSSSHYFDECSTKRKMSECAKHVTVVADHRKIGRRSSYLAVPFDSVDLLITGEKADEAQIAKFRDNGLKVQLV